MRLLRPTSARLLTASLLLSLLSSFALAWEFLYLEQSLDLAILESVERPRGALAGTIVLHHNCDSCPDTFAFDQNTRLDTPFGANRPLGELADWQGHPVSLYFSLPGHRVTLLEILPLSALQSAGDKAPQ